jgi:hypothetical protein
MRSEVVLWSIEETIHVGKREIANHAVKEVPLSLVLEL